MKLIADVNVYRDEERITPKVHRLEITPVDGSDNNLVAHGTVEARVGRFNGAEGLELGLGIDFPTGISPDRSTREVYYGVLSNAVRRLVLEYPLNGFIVKVD